MGCCGHDFGSIKEIKEVILRNTAEFKKINNLRKFRDRADKWDLKSGVCRNVIKMNGQVYCPLHPARNQGRDLRSGHCDINFLCKTAEKFNRFNKEKQKEFLGFVKGKKLDTIDYGIKIDDGSLMKEFLRK